MPEQDITATTQDGIILVKVASAALEEHVAQSLLEETQAAADAAPAAPVVLDLSSVEAMPSMAIGALVTLWKKLQENRQRLVLAGAQSSVRNTLAVCRLDKLFEFCDTQDAALARLRAASA